MGPGRPSEKDRERRGRRVQGRRCPSEWSGTGDSRPGTGSVWDLRVGDGSLWTSPLKGFLPREESSLKVSSSIFMCYKVWSKVLHNIGSGTSFLHDGGETPFSWVGGNAWMERVWTEDVLYRERDLGLWVLGINWDSLTGSRQIIVGRTVFMEMRKSRPFYSFSERKRVSVDTWGTKDRYGLLRWT